MGRCVIRAEGAFYNELDPYASRWLSRLIAAGHIVGGPVEACDIKELAADSIRDAIQFHAFAGVGVWSYALRLAGWPDDVPVWTGSCPCQPFSQAGKRKGADDARHLWPEWYRLIAECRPPTIFGEQVASPDGRLWLDAVSLDLEALGYAVGAADLCAAGEGAPHIRQRLFWVAYSDSQRHARERLLLRPGEEGRQSTEVPEVARRREARHGRGPWGDVEWLQCSDGKIRPTQPGLFPLAHGATSRVGRLRAYGNAIVPQVAATFIRAVMDL